MRIVTIYMCSPLLFVFLLVLFESLSSIYLMLRNRLKSTSDGFKRIFTYAIHQHAIFKQYKCHIFQGLGSIHQELSTQKFPLCRIGRSLFMQIFWITATWKYFCLQNLKLYGSTPVDQQRCYVFSHSIAYGLYMCTYKYSAVHISIVGICHKWKISASCLCSFTYSVTLCSIFISNVIVHVYIVMLSTTVYMYM